MIQNKPTQGLSIRVVTHEQPFDINIAYHFYIRAFGYCYILHSMMWQIDSNILYISHIYTLSYLLPVFVCKKIGLDHFGIESFCQWHSIHYWDTHSDLPVWFGASHYFILFKLLRSFKFHGNLNTVFMEKLMYRL